MTALAPSTRCFLAPVLTTYKWQDVAIKASPLILIGVGLAAGNRAAIWNIGAEGQYVVGGLAGDGRGSVDAERHRGHGSCR